MSECKLCTPHSECRTRMYPLSRRGGDDSPPRRSVLSFVAKHRPRAIDPVIAVRLVIMLQPKGRVVAQDPAIRATNDEATAWLNRCLEAGCWKTRVRCSQAARSSA
jgi:hypothetical protein